MGGYVGALGREVVPAAGVSPEDEAERRRLVETIKFDVAEAALLRAELERADSPEEEAAAERAALDLVASAQRLKDAEEWGERLLADRRKHLERLGG